MLLAFISLLAEAPAVDFSDYLPGLSNLGALGFVAWYAHYTTTVAIPKLMDAHRAERLEMQTRFDTTLKEERIEFSTAVHDLLAEMREQRKQFGEWMKERNLPHGA